MLKDDTSARKVIFSSLEELRTSITAARSPEIPCVVIPSGTCCLARGSSAIVDAFLENIQKHGLEDKVALRTTGCGGFCQSEPNVVIYPQEIYYQHVTPEDAEEILIETALNGNVINRLLCTDPETGERFAHLTEIPFFKKQQRLLLGDTLRIDPTNIEDYLAADGYSALAMTLKEKRPEEVIEEIKNSGLRGRGGGGFPTGRKWEECRNAPGDIKYVIVNADEGDPGAYMDRNLLEGNPHMVIEGLIIGAYAIGAGEGYIYVRQEYPLAVQHVETAIEQARQYGFLGKSILGSDFSFDVKIHRGAGAFVSGESSAMMEAIEGRVGEPKPKYIHTVVKGLRDKPSNLNNVETWVNVPIIMKNGADWFASIGTEGSKGTKIFSLVGKVHNTGLVEVPMGTSIRDIVFEAGGGISGNKKLKAVQTGGPSGGCIPEEYIDTPVDFDELVRLGAMMGSGGMIVMDEDTCMVDLARYFTDFLCDESCGKCLPCREGLHHMRDILVDITEGRGGEESIALLEELAPVIAATSLCALGQTAPNPILTTLRFFRDEYLAHIMEKRCPSLSCRELVTYHIDPDRCKACMICLRSCPADAITGGKGTIHEINQDKCTRCGTCFDVCPERFSAVTRRSGQTAASTSGSKK